MEIQQLYYFASIYRTKNITRSAEECHISTQGISVSLHRLENELGQKLFERTSKGLVPTASADYLILRARRILASRDECIDFFLRNKSPERVCRISLAQGTIEEYAGPALKKFKDTFPEVQIEIHEGTDKNCIEDVLIGTTELAVVGGPVDQDLFRAVELLSVRYALITPVDSPWASSKEITIPELKSIPISILESGNSTNSTLMALCDREGFEPNIFCIPQYVLALFSLVENGLCSGIVTESLAHRMKNPNISIVPISHPDYFWKISIIHNKNAVLSKESKAMWDVMTGLKKKLGA